jgi:hypothetical protein
MPFLLILYHPDVTGFESYQIFFPTAIDQKALSRVTSAIAA